MSEGEARALIFAGLPGPAADLGLATEVTTARLKLLAALPAGLREEAARTAAVFHLDTPGWYREPEQPPHLPLFVDAVLTRRAVDVRYRRWLESQEVDRRLCPYGLVLKSGVWYLVAAGRSRIATYRVAQVFDAAVSDEPFDRPERLRPGHAPGRLPGGLRRPPLHGLSDRPSVPAGTPTSARQRPAGGGLAHGW